MQDSSRSSGPPAALDEMLIVAHLVSRVETIVLVSALQAEGIAARADGIHHASVEVNSLALAGHRIWVPATQLDHASALIREIGANANWAFSYGLRKAVLRFLSVWLGTLAPFYVMGIAVGAPVWTLVTLPLNILSVPVNPQGRGDYYLVP